MTAPSDPDYAPLWSAWLQTHGLRPLVIKGKTLLPVVQGGMGVGISAHRLAGTVSALGGMGTIASIDLRHHHPDLLARTRGLRHNGEARAIVDAANREALAREIAAARALSQGRGLLAVNVMRAVSDYPHYVAQSLASGADALVVGAGLPLDLPDLAADHPQVALIPILSDARGIQLIVKKWERKQRLPDAIVIEHPAHAGGHLGAARVEDLSNPRFEFERVLPETLEFFRSAGLEGRIPLIAAGGIRTHEDIRRLQELGADGVQLGTPFAVTEECDAHPVFKQVLAEARAEDLVTFTSVAGLPARAVATPWLTHYLRFEAKLKSLARTKPRCTLLFDCLAQCGLRDGKAEWGQFCIDTQLAAALRGDLRKGLFFSGAAGRLPFGRQIRSVRELLERLLGGPLPAGVQ
ncbi:MAG: nitronate monooxygenase [Betaproteobacteria bacterium]|nr:nitronate monooxygenase [Betaproteobacteria bacterium]MDE2622383.1 nitronate monooxygenase [Betaproteobacteria bacterium]